MESALLENCTVRGVKGPTALMNLVGFDLVWGFSPDYLHSLLLGVTRYMAELWLSNVDNLYYIGSPRNLNVINARLCSIRIPHIFTRSPRSLGLRKYWKATEWRNWLLYYSIPCLQDILPTQYLRHWTILVEASFLALKDDISYDEIDRIDQLLNEFVVKTQTLYSASVMTSNVHQLLHYAKAILMFGPAWSRSTFVFEHNNGFLQRLVTAAKGVAMQILNRFWFKSQLTCYIESSVLKISNRIRMAISDFSTYSLIQNCDVIHLNGTDIYLLGRNMHTAHVIQQQQFLSEILDIDHESVKFYSRVVLSKDGNNSIYHSVLYSRARKMDNTVVLACGEYYRLKSFVLYKDSTSNSHCKAIAQKLIVNRSDDHDLPPHILRCEFPPDDHLTTCIDINDINRVCLLINVEAVKYVCKIPNAHERD